MLPPLAISSGLGMIYFCIAFIPLLHLLRKFFPTVPAIFIADLCIAFPLLSFLLYNYQIFIFFLEYIHILPLFIQPFLAVFLGMLAAFILSKRMGKMGYRTLFHLIAGILILYFLLLSTGMTFIIVSFSLTLFLIAEYLRGCEPNEVTDFIRRVFEPALREKEKKRYLATFHFLLGCLLVILYLPPDISFASILILTFGDSLASMVGTRYGSIKIFYNREKSLQGSLAMFFLCSILLLIMGFEIRGILSSVSATFLESLPSRGADNLLIPIGGGLILFIL
jgi:dolichol kinase